MVITQHTKHVVVALSIVGAVVFSALNHFIYAVVGAVILAMGISLGFSSHRTIVLPSIACGLAAYLAVVSVVGFNNITAYLAVLVGSGWAVIFEPKRPLAVLICLTLISLAAVVQVLSGLWLVLAELGIILVSRFLHGRFIYNGRLEQL